jgi:hypothetical protein
MSYHEAALAGIIDRDGGELGAVRAAAVDEAVEVGAIVGVGGPHRFAHLAIEGGVGLSAGLLGFELGPVEELKADRPLLSASTMKGSIKARSPEG